MTKGIMIFFKEYDTTIEIITNRIHDFIMLYNSHEKAISAGNLELANDIKEILKEKTNKLVEIKTDINNLWSKAIEEIDKLKIKDISVDYKTD